MTKKRRQPKQSQIEYPIATVAFYGPDDRKATKMAVGILHGGAGHVSEIKRWYADHMGDIRNDPHVAEELSAFLKAHGVKTVGGIVDRIIGCPHEEGVDYPEGQNCPMCPFWATRDRWTGDILPEDHDEEKGRTSPMHPTSLPRRVMGSVPEARGRASVMPGRPGTRPAPWPSARRLGNHGVDLANAPG